MRSASEITKHFLWHFILHDKWTVPNLADSIEYLVTEAVEAMQERLCLPGNGYHRTNPRESSLDKLAIEVWDTEFMANVIFQQVLGMDAAETGLDKLLYKCDKFDIERLPRWRTRAECAIAGLEPYQMHFEEFSFRFPYDVILQKMATADFADHMWGDAFKYYQAEEEFDAYVRARIDYDYPKVQHLEYPETVDGFDAYAVCIEAARKDMRRIDPEIWKSYKDYQDGK
jgi:hypothetical protein